MQSDDDQIRQIVSRWLAASRSGDVDTVLSLMTDDVVFLMPGRPPMRKAEFAAAARAQSGADAPQIESSSHIEEIQVAGDWAFMRSRMSVVVTPPHGAPPMTRAGYTLTVLKKENGHWLLARDANLLAPVPHEPT